MVSYPKIKDRMTGMKLLSRMIYQPIEVLLSFFSLDESTHLRSLSLMALDDKILAQIRSKLPSLLNLHSFEWKDF
jgi:hypothetical protein